MPELQKSSKKCKFLARRVQRYLRALQRRKSSWWFWNARERLPTYRIRLDEWSRFVFTCSKLVSFTGLIVGMQPVYSSQEDKSTTQILTTQESTIEENKEEHFSAAGNFDGYIIVVIVVLTMVVVATTCFNSFKKPKKSDEEDHFNTVTVWSFKKFHKKKFYFNVKNSCFTAILVFL